MKCEFGYCSVCEKDIAKVCNDCGVKKPTPDYTEITMTWSNGSHMKIALCVSCATTGNWATPEAKAGITKAHHEIWAKAGGKFDPEIVIV